MKLSINQGPTDSGLVIPHNYCKQLSSFFWEWKDSLPAQIGYSIEVITVNPTTSVYSDPAIVIKVVLSGEGHSWRIEFEENVPCSIMDNVNIFATDLQKSLRSALQSELSKHQSIQSEINSLIDKLKVNY